MKDKREIHLLEISHREEVLHLLEVSDREEGDTFVRGQ